MNKFIITDKKEVFFKNILIDSERIMASDENYGSESAFREKMASGNVGKLDTVINVRYSEIDKVIPFDDENILQIFYGNEKSGFDLGNSVDYKEVRDFILSQKNFSPSTEKVGNAGAIVKPALYTLAVAIFSAVLINMANEIENGNTVVASGSKRGFKKLLILIAETLGFYGCLALGIVATVGFVVYTIKQIKNSKTEVTVYK